LSTSLENTDRVGKVISDQVRAKLGNKIVTSIVARAGIQQVDPGDPTSKTGEHVGMVLVAIDPKLAPTLNGPEILAKLKSIPKPAEATKLTAETLQGGPPVGKPLTVTLRSSDYNELSQATQAFMAKITEIAGVENLEKDEDPSP